MNHQYFSASAIAQDIASNLFLKLLSGAFKYVWRVLVEDIVRDTIKRELQAHQKTDTPPISVNIVVNEVYSILNANPRLKVVDGDEVALAPGEPETLDDKSRLAIARDAVAALRKTISDRQRLES